MKKVLSYILISLIISANLLAPISVGFDTNEVKIKNNKAEATFDNKISLTETPSKTDKTITINFSVAYSQIPARLTKQGVRITKTDPVSDVPEVKIVPDSDFTAGGQDADGFYIYTGSVLFDNLTPNTPYIITAEARQLNMLTWTSANFTYDIWQDATPVDNIFFIIKINDTVTTNPEGTTTLQTQATQKKATTDNTTMPACSFSFGILGSGTFTGCIAQAVYYVLFVPTSYLFALAGTFFDYTFAYSVNDTSYRSAFVVQGWGLVRDFCNMFFIFIMLYIAISTILSVHGFKTKETIINVVIIGLFINFSLFATQLIIDASNITARVFYNSDAIKITQKGANGVTEATAVVGEGGVISLSEALVNKVNPQNIIINSGKINDISPQVTADSSVVKTNNATDNKNNMTAGTFILIVFLAVAINVVGIIVFLSVGLIFVTRVIGLWLAMIMAPLAFFTYITPGMKDTKMIGWTKWWPETFKLAFLAPVFIFFMYIILKFLQMDIISDPLNSTNGLGFLVATIIPFAFIMILMLKAKSLASDMSGEFGQKITGAVAAAGGMALGGAALGTAFLGRQTFGAFMKGASTGDTAARRLAAEDQARLTNPAHRDPTLRTFDRIKGRLSQVTQVDRAQQFVGTRLNRNQHQIEHATHSRHLLDTAAAVVAPGKKWEELNGEQRDLARTNLERDRYVRENRNRAGTPLANLGTRNWDNMTTIERDHVNAQIAAGLAGHTTVADTTLIQDARRKVGLGENIIQSTVGGSFDIRNLSKLIANDQDRGLNKFATGLTAALAGGMRSMIKQSNVNYGEGQKDFVKDLGHTITEALKSTTIKVDLSHVGEEKKEGQTAAHH